MSEVQNESLPDERGITPVTGAGDDGRKSMLKRGFGALALIAFAALIIWGTWKGGKPANDPAARKLVIRQAADFEPAKEPAAAPITTAAIAAAPLAAAQAAPLPATDQLLESARRAPVLAYNRPLRPGHLAREAVTGEVGGSPVRLWAAGAAQRAHRQA
jgi:type IV secretion system protein VirB10